MSTNRNRAKYDKAINGSEYRRIIMEEKFPLYWDEGVSFYPRWRPGFKNSGKQLVKYQMRQYRTWKHNRKTQWK